MKRILGSLILAAGVISIGSVPVRAATITESPPLVVLTSSQEYTNEQILILGSPDLIQNPFFQSFLSSYVNTNQPALTFLTTNGIYYPDKNFSNAKPVVGTNEPNVKSGGTNGIQANSSGPSVGSTGSVVGSAGTVASVPAPASVAPAPASVPVPGPKTLQLFELYPNTTGNDKEEEFITVKNTGNTAMTLTGWMLKDASGKTYVFESATLAPNAMLKISAAQSGIALNNNKETVELFAPDQQLVDTITYEKTIQGDTLIRSGNTWSWSSEVPASQQAPAPTVPMEIANTNEPKTTITPEPVKPKPTPTETATVIITPTDNKESVVTEIQTATMVVTVAQAKNKEDGAVVELMATATVVPGVLGKQFFYVQDNSGGIQVYKYDADFPNMEIGTFLHLKGEMSTSGQERRIKIGKNGFIKILGQDPPLEALNVPITDLSKNQMGTLVKTTGVIKSVGSDSLEIEQNGQTLEIAVVAYTGIDTSPLLPGMKLEVTGIVRPFGEKIKLAPRSQNDLVVLEEKTPLVTGTVDSGKTSEQKMNQLIGGILAAAATSAVIFWIARQYTRKKQIYASTHLAPTTETIH